MRFFEWFYRNRVVGGYADSKGIEKYVTCPFPHKSKGGTEPYFETRPSATINQEKSLFWCNVCGEGFSEPVFMQKVFEQQGCSITYNQALKIIEFMEKPPIVKDYEVMKRKLKEQPEQLKLLEKLGLSSIVEDLELGYLPSEGGKVGGITFPVSVFGEIRDVRRYNPKSKFKMKGWKGSTCLAFPFDKWVDEDSSEPTILCEGEKDTAIARANGFRSICFTNGAKSFPKILKPFFAGQTFYICYDNDQAGREGSEKMGVELVESGATVYIVDISEVCKEDKEDLWDFFMKYRKSPDDLKGLMKKAPEFTGEIFEKARKEKYPFIKLIESGKGKYVRKIVSSQVSVIGSFDRMYRVPERVTVSLLNKDSSEEEVLDKYEWDLENHLQDLLYLIETNSVSQYKYFEKFVHKDKDTRVKVSLPKSFRNVFRYMVGDLLDTEVIESTETQRYKPFEMTLYSLGDSQDETKGSLYDGEKYLIFYETIINPKDQSISSVLHKAEPLQTGVDSFKVTPSVTDTLKCFQGSTSRKMEELYQRAKGLVAPHLIKDIFEPIELFFHTPLKFKFSGRVHRGYLDCMIVGESRTGKSTTAKALLSTYQLGTFVSLKTATPEALIGGSHGTSSKGYEIRMGVIPRNNKGAVIMEEFSTFGQQMIHKLTEIRSSNVVRIHRVSGEQTAPAFTRMLTLTNQKPKTDRMTIPLNQYSSGIEVITDLVGTSEDIARYDFFRLIGKPEEEVPENTPIKIPPYPIESYQNRIRWVWSRTEDQIIISPEVEETIIKWSKELNEKYGCHIQIFGTETWKKLTRVAIAVAASVVSTDETFEKLVVTDEHVAYAYNFLVDSYDNSLFRLAEYVQEERKYETFDHVILSIVEGFRDKYPTVFNLFDKGTTFSFRTLESFSGIDKDSLNTLLKNLFEAYLIRLDGGQIIPSQRYRLAVRKLNGNTKRLRKIWEG